MPCWRIGRSEEHTSELQSLTNLVCRLLLEKKKDHERYFCAPDYIVNYLFCVRNGGNIIISLAIYKFPIRFCANRHAYVRRWIFFNDTASTEIYTLSLHDALPI